MPEDADIVSRLVYGARASDVRHVIVDGRVVVRDGQPKTAKVEEIRREANKWARHLKKKTGL